MANKSNFACRPPDAVCHSRESGDFAGPPGPVIPAKAGILRGRRGRGRGFRSEMQLTPMIDVMTTLLAVFMFAAPMVTNGIDLDLPSGGNFVSAGDHAMILSVDRRGNYYLSEDKMPLENIVRRLSAMRAENPKLSVMLAGDSSSGYGDVMRAMGALRDAGFDRVSMKTRPE